MKKIAVLDSENKKISDALKNHFNPNEISVTDIKSLNEIDNSFDIVITNDYNNEAPKDTDAVILNIHPSLLPAFEGEAAIVRAYQDGVKVSGVTVENLLTKKIIAQYPVLISNLTNYLEFEAEMKALEISLITIVTEKMLEGKIFDFTDLLGGCNGNCSGNCGHCS